MKLALGALAFACACFLERDASTLDVAASTRSDSAQAPEAAHDPTSPPAPSSAAEIAGLRARWQEALELDLPAEITKDAALVERGGPLAADADAIALAARALAATGAEARAQELLDRAQVDPASRPRLEVARARLALERDELERALSLLLERKDAAGGDAGGAPVELRFPALPEAWLLAGRALARRGHDAASERFLARFVELAPHDVEVPAAWHMIAQGAIRRGDAERANAAGERARQSGQWQAYYRTRRLQIREQPREPLPRLGLAQLWLAAGEPARAKTVLVELLAIEPVFCRALALAGEAERALGDIAAARAAYERALACDPDLAEARFDRALLALSEGELDAARADLEWIVARAAGNEPRFLRAHLELARILRAGGDEAGASAHHERYAALGGKEPL